MTLELLSEHGCHGGVQRFYRHASAAIGLPMRFSVYLPPQAQAAGGKLPALFYLAGLTCTEETFMIKAGAQRFAAEHGLVLVAPDTSPRGAGVAGEADAWDFGVGAGFYVDATEAPFDRHYRMRTYVLEELPALLAAHFPADMARQSIMGHSMGGHGALTLALSEPERFRAVSAFAPIVAPSQVPWGEKALGGYLGSDRAAWRRADAVALIEDGARVPEILVDQGEADGFLAEQLKPHLLVEACAGAGIDLTLRMQPGYDHSYYFISTFMADHVAWHAKRLR